MLSCYWPSLTTDPVFPRAIGLTRTLQWCTRSGWNWCPHGSSVQWELDMKISLYYNMCNVVYFSILCICTFLFPLKVCTTVTSSFVNWLMSHVQNTFSAWIDGEASVLHPSGWDMQQSVSPQSAVSSYNMNKTRPDLTPSCSFKQDYCAQHHNRLSASLHHNLTTILQHNLRTMLQQSLYMVSLQPHY